MLKISNKIHLVKIKGEKLIFKTKGDVDRFYFLISLLLNKTNKCSDLYGDPFFNTYVLKFQILILILTELSWELLNGGYRD